MVVEPEGAVTDGALDVYLGTLLYSGPERELREGVSKAVEFLFTNFLEPLRRQGVLSCVDHADEIAFGPNGIANLSQLSFARLQAIRIWPATLY